MRCPPLAYERTSKITRRNGCPPGATTARASETSGPRSQKSLRDAGSVATNGVFPILSVTEALGRTGTNDPWAGSLAVRAYVPPFAPTFADTTANRIESSGNRTLTWVCVGSVPSCTAFGAAPCGSARPNVAQPGPTVYVASGLSAAAAVPAPPNVNNTADTQRTRTITPARRVI